MVTIETKQAELELGPQEITPNNVMFWSVHAKELKGEGFLAKAQKFLEYDCLKYIGNNRFICLPLNDSKSWEYELQTFSKKPYEHNYNSRVYLMENKGKWECSCQGWHTKEKKGTGKEDGIQCSHTLALMLWLKLKPFSKGLRE